MQISIKTNFPQVQAALDALRQDVRDRALASALNKTVEQGRTQMIRQITDEYVIKASDVRERLRIGRATFRQGSFAMSATLAAGGKRSMNLLRFVERMVTLAEMRRRNKKEGGAPQLRFRIKKSGGKQVLPGAFIATANGGTAVFQRVGKGRYPIKAISTISVPSMFNQKRINAAVVTAMQQRFPDIAAREIAFYISKFNGAA